MTAAIPAVEAADHRDPAGIGRPHGKAHTGDAVDRMDLGAEGAAEVAMVAFIEQLQVHFA